jgi:hypothetical protein
MRPGILALLLGATLAACAGGPTTVEEARGRNLAFVESGSSHLASRYARRVVVVQQGGLAAAASAPDDAVRAAERKAPAPLHRFVFRPGDEGERQYSMAFMPTGGVVAGRRLFEGLGARASWRPGKPLVVERLGTRRELDLERVPRLEIEVETLDRERTRTLLAVVDLDFDGVLLVPQEAAAEMGLERFEIPGSADVQVALGRPFFARRALVLVRVPVLHLGAPMEAAFESRPDAGSAP